MCKGRKSFKGKKWSKRIKSSVCPTPYLRNHTSWLWFLVHVCKMMISPVGFFIFLNFYFWGFQVVKRAKNDLQFFQCVLLYVSGAVDHIIKILIISTGVFHFFFKCNIVNIKIILFFVGPLEQFFKLSVFQVHQWIPKRNSDVCPTFFTCGWFFFFQFTAGGTL